MKKITIIVPSLSGGGGAERTAVLLANGLSETGYSVSICAMSKGEPSYRLYPEVKFYKVDSAISYNKKLLKNLERLKFLKNHISTEKPDLIVGYTIQGGIAACVLSRLLNVKCLVCERQDPHQFSKIMRIIRDKLYRYASAAVFQTVDAQKYFSNIILESIIIPNFIDVQNLPDIVDFKLRKPIIVSVGRLTSAKDHLLLIHAFAMVSDFFPDFLLKIYGEGPLYLDLSKAIEDLNLSKRVFLCGRKDDIFNEIKEAKIFVLSSRYEGYPNALIEAMAMGLSCISTDCPCGGPRAIIKAGYNGELVPVGNAEEMSKVMIKLMSDEEMQCKYIKNGVRIRNQNSRELILDKWVKYIDYIIDNL